jgi:GNAT superfamily N-acetyltransferase
VYCGKDAAHGAAIVLPPGVIDFPTRRMVPTILRRLSRTGLSYLSRILPVSTELNRKRPKLPHWYVLLIGVGPAWQGRGLGRRMMQHILQRADAAAQPVYLETATRDNIRFYERLGFHVQEEFRCHGGRGPLTWSMLHAAD